MGAIEDAFELLIPDEAEDSATPGRRRGVRSPSLALPHAGGATVARLVGFGLDEAPRVSGLDALPGEIVPARTTIALSSNNIGEAVVVLFEGCDPRRPIIIGVVQSPGVSPGRGPAGASHVTVQADEERYVVTAEREISLRCGDASITLTRAGKVIIRGNYIVSQSTGYNKIKGAAIEIN